MIKQYLEFCYGKDFYLKNMEKSSPNSLLNAKILNDDEIEFTSQFGDGSFIINIIDDTIKGSIKIDWNLASNFIGPNTTIKDLIKNSVVEDCLKYCENLTAQCEIIKSMTYNFKIGEGFKYKYPINFEIRDLFVNIIPYVSDICIRRNNDISNMKYLLWLLSTLQSLEKEKINSLKYSFNITGLNISDSQLLSIVDDNWISLSNVDSILFEDCTISVNSPMILNLFEKGTKIKYKMCDVKLKEFIV